MAAPVPRSLDRLLIVAFLLAIGLPLAATIAGVEGADPSQENRTLAPPPTWTSLTRVGPELSAWFDDHFAFRSTLIRWEAVMRFAGLGMSPSPMVMEGKDGFLYYAEDGAIEDYGRVSAFPPEMLVEWKKSVERADTWLTGQGIAYVFMVAPDKHEIYPEFVPDGITPLEHPSRVDQILDAVSHSAHTVDLRPTLLEAKSAERLYHRTDTHWNDVGAWLAYRDIIEAVRRQDPNVPPAWPREDFDERVERSAAGDLARMMGLRSRLSEDWVVFVPRKPRKAVAIDPPGGAFTAHHGWLVTEIPGSTLPRAVVFRDSFTSALVPFLSEHFSRVAYAWQKDFDAPLVIDERADVVIQEIVSRHLQTFTPTPSLVPDP